MTEKATSQDMSADIKSGRNEHMLSDNGRTIESHEMIDKAASQDMSADIKSGRNEHLSSDNDQTIEPHEVTDKATSQNMDADTKSGQNEHLSSDNGHAIERHETTDKAASQDMDADTKSGQNEHLSSDNGHAIERHETTDKAASQDMDADIKSGRNEHLSFDNATPSSSMTCTQTKELKPERHDNGSVATKEERSGFVPEDMEVFQKPMCLVSTDGKNLLKIETEAVTQIAKITWPIVVVSVVGLYRTGKSYLMNRLAGQCKGFVMGKTIESTTKGIWVWCKVHPQKPNTVLMLLDTEGLGDVKKGDTNHDNKICTIATLLCNCLVYNTNGVFDQDAISKLTFISEMAKCIRFEGKCSDDNSKLKMITPDFVLCLRDFSLELSVNGEPVTEDEYLEHALAIQESKDVTFNKARECIQKYFPVRRCFTFPLPGDGHVLANLESLQFDHLSDTFNEATSRFADYIHCCKAKELLCSKPINGPMFTELAVFFVTAIQNGAVPDVDDAFNAVAKFENIRVRKTAFERFEEEMRALKLPAPSSDLEKHNTRSQQTAIEYMRKNAVHHTDILIEHEMQMEMNNLWNAIKVENTAKVRKMCDDRLHLSCQESIKADIEDGVYAVAGGYKNFQRYIETLKQYFLLSLGDYEETETLWTWYGFLAEIKPMEEKIIEYDEALSKQEKEDDRKRYEGFIAMVKDHQNSTIDALKEQRQKSEGLFEKLYMERFEMLGKYSEQVLDLCETKVDKEEKVKVSKELAKETEEKIKQLLEVQEKNKIRQDDEFERQLEEIDRQHEKLTRKFNLK